MSVASSYTATAMTTKLPESWSDLTTSMFIKSLEYVIEDPADPKYASAGTAELKQLRLLQLGAQAVAKKLDLGDHYNHDDKTMERKMRNKFCANKLTVVKFLAKALGEPLPSKSTTPKKANRNAKANTPTRTPPRIIKSSPPPSDNLDSTLSRLANLAVTFQEEQAAVNQRQDAMIQRQDAVNQRQGDLNQEQQRWNHHTHNRFTEFEHDTRDRLTKLERTFGLTPPRNTRG
mmetsp:Transcript_28498/g.46682  ORF Transcript_28498/g.46682 Transcript_28498/m.46682 type:complete len:232 (+) Transcript_28498:118-813(+)